MTEITLGWPPSALSPNARVHWAKLATIKKAYRIACGWQAREQVSIETLQRFSGSSAPLRLELEFVKPNRRAMDQDNLVARMKSGIDGVCDALGIDDRLFNLGPVRVADQVGGYVKVRIYEEHEE